MKEVAGSVGAFSPARFAYTGDGLIWREETAINLILHIPDEAVPGLRAKASGLPLETFAEQVLLERIHDESNQMPDSSVADAARRLGTFGKRQGLSVGGMTIKELLNESRL